MSSAEEIVQDAIYNRLAANEPSLRDEPTEQVYIEKDASSKAVNSRKMPLISVVLPQVSGRDPKGATRERLFMECDLVIYLPMGWGKLKSDASLKKAMHIRQKARDVIQSSRDLGLRQYSVYTQMFDFDHDEVEVEGKFWALPLMISQVGFTRSHNS